MVNEISKTMVSLVLIKVGQSSVAVIIMGTCTGLLCFGKPAQKLDRLTDHAQHDLNWLMAGKVSQLNHLVLILKNFSVLFIYPLLTCSIVKNSCFEEIRQIY